MALGTILEDEDVDVQSQGESQGNIGLLCLLSWELFVFLILINLYSHYFVDCGLKIWESWWPIDEKG